MGNTFFILGTGAYLAAILPWQFHKMNQQLLTLKQTIVLEIYVFASLNPTSCLSLEVEPFGFVARRNLSTVGASLPRQGIKES